MIWNRNKQLRQKKGISLSELANLADVSKSYLSQLERGIQSNPSLQFLVKVATPLDTNIDYLLRDLKYSKSLDNELDEEWKVLIKQAIKAGLKKEDSHEYQNYIKYQQWIREQNSHKK
jgi:XRE family transcriptional regulator, master regulator for biofilm formation